MTSTSETKFKQKRLMGLIATQGIECQAVTWEWSISCIATHTEISSMRPEMKQASGTAGQRQAAGGAGAHECNATGLPLPQHSLQALQQPNSIQGCGSASARTTSTST